MERRIRVEIKATPNYSHRTFTIRKRTKGILIKYRTYPMSKEEFESNLKNTYNDWINFLRRSDDCYTV